MEGGGKLVILPAVGELRDKDIPTIVFTKAVCLCPTSQLTFNGELLDFICGLELYLP